MINVIRSTHTFTKNKWLFNTLISFIVFCIFAFHTSHVHAHVIPPLNAEYKIANWIKPTLDQLTPADIQQKMQEKFVSWNLMSADGTWKNNTLAAATDTLMPPLTKENLYDFLDNIAEKSEQNPYLHDVLTEIETKDLSDFHTKVESEKHIFMPDVVIFAKALDNLTYAARHNEGILESAYNAWEEKRKSISVRHVVGTPFFIKLLSVREPVKNMIHCMKAGSIDQDHLKYMLPINILEATAYDFYKGHYGNSYAGLTLALTPPGGIHNPKTGSGPATLSADGKACQLHMPYGNAWNDLYSTWNLGFVADINNSPYCFAKLLIPSVGGYQSTPSEYIFNRAFALYATMNYILYKYNDEHISGQRSAPLNWQNDIITNCFSKLS